jgi:DNA-directed RNA polymerase specialized sigma24 family protein
VDLRVVLRARRKIDLINERIAIIRSALEAGERVLHYGAGSNYPTDRLSTNMAKLDELERSLVEVSLEYECEAIIAEEAIDRLPEAQQKIARARYIEGLSWSDVAEKTRYSKSHCKNTNHAIIHKVSTQ